jgi:hypothetical protein
MKLAECHICHKPIRIYPSCEGRKKYCSIECRSIAFQKVKSGAGNGRYVGGLKVQSNYNKRSEQYYYIYNRDQKKSQHRVLAEGIMGRKLKRSEIVHHINGNSLDNSQDNLLICSVGYHQWLHTKMSHLYMNEHFS